MGGYLEQRGRRIEPLVALLDRAGRRMALLPSIAFADVQLRADDEGFVRCRLGGLPALLAPVTSTIRLDLVSLAALLPRWASELAVLAGDEAARAMLEGELLFEPTLTSERIEEIVVAHEIRADDLYFLGERPAKEVPALRALTLRWPTATLALALDAAAFERQLATQRLAPDADVRVTWNDVPVALPTATLAWHGEELAELAILVTMQIESGARDDVLRLLDTALPDRGDALAPSLALASILNVWGVALRQRGDLPDAIAMLDRARAMGCDLDPQLAQQTAYNLGYAKLQTTMKARVTSGKRGGVDTVHATYDLAPAHRALWEECLVLFEEALALAPEDATALAQRDQVRRLLALLDGAPPKGGASPAAKARRAATASTPEPSTWNWVPLVIAITIAIVGAAYLRREREEALQHAATRSAAPSSPVSDARAPIASADATRRAALAALASPIAASDAPCPLRVMPPEDVPRGAVVAPTLGRAAGTGELFGTDFFDATIRAWAAQYAPTLDVHTIGHARVGPVHDEDGPSNAWTRAPYRTTLLVTGWTDPVVDGSSIVPGHVEGQLVVWSVADQRFACAASVDASNAPALALTVSADPAGDQDDPLHRARLDLIDQAVRRGIPELRAVRAPE